MSLAPRSATASGAGIAGLSNGLAAPKTETGRGIITEEDVRSNSLSESRKVLERNVGNQGVMVRKGGYQIATYMGAFLTSYKPHIARVNVVHSDGSEEQITLDHHIPQIKFLYNAEPLKIGESVVLTGGEDNSDNLARLLVSSSNSTFDILDHSPKNISILAVQEKVMPEGGIQPVLILGDGLRDLEIPQGKNVTITKVKEVKPHSHLEELVGYWGFI